MMMVLVVTCNCGFAENRRNQRKSIPKGRGNSPKSGDDPIGQVFAYVIAGSNGFERVVVLPIGSVRKAAFHYSRFRILWIFLSDFLPPRCGFPFSNGARPHFRNSGRDVINADSPEKSKEIDPSRWEKFAEIEGRSHRPSFCLRHRGFERVSTGCRAPDRVGPRSGLP